MSLIAYYPFINGSLSNEVGNNVATNNGAVYSKMISKDSYYFNNGSATYINHIGINVPQICSFSVWNYQTNNSEQMLFYVYDGGGFVGVYFSGIGIYWNNGDSQSDPFRNGAIDIVKPSLNTWHHYVITCDLSDIKLYIDGIYVGSAIAYKNPARANIVIGNYHSLSGYPNSGYISNFRVYNHTLSPNEVTNLYKNNSSENNVSLIAHYPLNGNTDDYSGNGFNATNSGATIDNNGKIGKCYSFTQTGADGINITQTNFTELQNNYSIGLWVNPSGSHYHYNGTFISSGNWNTTCWAFGVSQDNTQIDVLGRGYNKWVNYTLPLNTWTHLLCTVSNGISKLYANGIYIGQANVTSALASDATNTCIGRETYAGGYFSFNGKINDVRVYDSVLSLKEIKEIAKAKILHYAFDDFQEPIVNIYNQVPMLNGMGHGLTYTYLGLENGWEKYSISGTKPIGDNYPYTFNVMATTNLLANNKQSMRFSMKCNCLEKYGTTLGGNVTNIIWDSGNTTYIPNIPDTSNIVYDYLVENMSHHEVNPQTQPFYLYSYGIEGVNFNPATDFIWLKNHQIEDKDHSTEYTPTSRAGQIQDSSGYRYHASLNLTTTPKWVNTNKIGVGAYYWLNQTKRINSTINKPSDTITMNCWFKSSVAGGSGYHIPISIDGGLYELSITPSGNIRVGFYLTGVRYVYNWGSGIIDGNWHMLTAVYDGNYIRGYIDGVEVGNSNIAGVLENNAGMLRVGGYDDSDTYGNIDAYEDDVRIYATALSPTDILELYNVGQHIHDVGNVETTVFNENGYNTHNLIPYKGWDVGTFVYKDGWANHWGDIPSQYTSKIILMNNPQGNLDKMYENKVIDNTFEMYRTQGLQASTTALIDVSKTYRLSNWIYLSSNTGSNNYWYAGYQGSLVCDLNTTTQNGNPYHNVISGASNNLGIWLLCVSYVYPYGSTNNVNNSKRYLQDGTIHSYGTDYNWHSNVSDFYLRWLFNYQYNQPGLNQYTLMYRPRFEIVDGTEPSIQELLLCKEHKPLSLLNPDFTDKHTIDSNQFKEAFTTGITFIRDDSGNTQKLYCNYSEGQVFAKTLSGSFVVHNITFTTISQIINPQIYRDRVICNMDSNTIYVNKLIEN